MLSIAGWLTSWLSDADETSSLEQVNASPSPDTDSDQPDPFSLPVWDEGLRVYGQFEVERNLGDGSLGPVYLLRNRLDERRYVVKRIRFPDRDTREAFLTDMQTWVYLPEHPHLGACRFIRTHGNEADLFAEPMEGTCLQDFIDTGKLYLGGKEAALERMLDIAIQTAWGLQALEDLKLLHGNLKPTDIFISREGTVRITSMGLAKATENVLRADGQPAGRPSPLYASPEVSDGGVITETSDLWCWGLNVLQLFAGKVTWGPPPEPEEDETEEEPEMGGPLQKRVGPDPEDWGGQTALRALEQYLQRQESDAALPDMPAAVAMVLRRCFAEKLKDRWHSAIEVARELRNAYHSLFGREHTRHIPTAMHHGNRLIIAHARWSSAGGAQWLSPGVWEERIHRATGKPQPISPRRVDNTLGLQARAKHDHAAYENLQKRCLELIADGHAAVRHELAGLCVDHGFLHVGLEDLPGAIEHFDYAIDVWQQLVRREQREDLGHDLAMAYMHRAIALRHLGQFKEALADYERAIELWKNQVDREGRRELNATLGWAEASRAKVLFKLVAQQRGRASGLNREAVTLNEDLEEDGIDLNALRKRHETLCDQVSALRAVQTPQSGKASKPETSELGFALQKAEEELQKAAEELKSAEQRETDAKDKQQKARTVEDEAKSLQRRAEAEARAAIAVLQTEAKRTHRDDARAVLHWAERAFEGLL